MGSMKTKKARKLRFDLARLTPGSVVVQRSRVPRFLRPNDPLDDPALFTGGSLELRELGLSITADPGAEVEF